MFQYKDMTGELIDNYERTDDWKIEEGSDGRWYFSVKEATANEWIIIHHAPSEERITRIANRYFDSSEKIKKTSIAMI